jgi:nucleotide-binding universal stress UspA family protein
MTVYKTILACLSDLDSCSATLKLAFAIARDQGAHVVALHVRNDPASAIPLVGEGMSSAMIEEMMAVAEKQTAERATQIHAKFDSICAEGEVPTAGVTPCEAGFCAEWREVIGGEEEVVANAGRLTDLIVMARPLPDHDLPSVLSLNAALMETGRPLLLAPPELPATVGRHVAVFWNGSAEASRAVAFALPLLEKAEAVSILSAREEESVAPAELADYLARHGISAKVHSFVAGGQVGDSLITEAASLGADLVVMGAYTHSRLRQLILGGVTRHILHNAALPVLLSH